MFQNIKNALYFPVASYFRFFAKIKLAKWKPRIIVVTGSSGKTTLFELIKAQLGDIAYYTNHANSSFGIPFNILGLERKKLVLSEWFELFLSAPFKPFSKSPKQDIYIVEADCDRPGEGKFLTDLIKPEVTIWLSSSRTHSMNFDKLVQQNKFKNIEDAVAHEYGYFLANTRKLAIVNSDNQLILNEIKRTKAQIQRISKKSISGYKVSASGTEFKIKNQEFKFKYLFPEAVGLSIIAAVNIAEYLTVKPDTLFSEFVIPPGRSSIFKGIRNTTIVDSCYNSNFSSASEIINMFNMIDKNKKWAVIGDMLEQGSVEKEEHEKLAGLIVESNFDRVILLGPRIRKWGFSIIEEHYRKNVVSFESPKEVLDYLTKELHGGETILFKGARFLEGVIENLLADKRESDKLARREKIWETRRKNWGL